METGRGPRPDRFSVTEHRCASVASLALSPGSSCIHIRPSQSNDRRSLSIFPREVRVRAPPVEMLWPREDTVEPEHFMLGEILGSGGFGRVHRAIAKVSGAELAIKILPASSDGLAIAKEVELLRACRVRLPGSELGPFAFRHALLTSRLRSLVRAVGPRRVLPRRRPARDQRQSVDPHGMLRGEHLRCDGSYEALPYGAADLGRRRGLPGRPALPPPPPDHASRHQGRKQCAQPVDLADRTRFVGCGSEVCTGDGRRAASI